MRERSAPSASSERTSSSPWRHRCTSRRSASCGRATSPTRSWRSCACSCRQSEAYIRFRHRRSTRSSTSSCCTSSSASRSSWRAAAVRRRSLRSLHLRQQPHEGTIIEPFVARLRVFPFKSLDGADVNAAALVARGGLRSDRAFALFDEGGGFINGKREPRVHELRVGYDADVSFATFVSPRIATPFTFAFDDDPQ